VSLGKAHHIKTPANEAIVMLIKEAENAQSGSPQLSAEALRQVIKGG
jgi:hypothetical protein